MEPAPPSQPDAARAIASDRRRWFGLFALLTAPFLGVVDFFVVNLAMPALERDLHADYAEQQLVIAFYGLAYSVCVITGGRLGDTHGRKRIYLGGLAIFLLASIACGVASGPAFLLGGRLVQGIAAALLFPQTLSLIQVNFADHERPTALAFLGMTVGLASVTGQLAGGLFLHWNVLGLGWRALFLVNVPIGAVAFLGVVRTLHETRGEHPPRLDLGGVALASAGLALLLVGVVLGPERHWPAWSLWVLAASLPVLALFFVHERTAARAGRDPLLDLSLFRIDTFRIGVAVIGTYFAGGGILFLVLSLYLQKGLRLDPVAAAVEFLPFAVALLVASVVASRLAQRHRAWFLRGGLGLVILGLAILVMGLATLGASTMRITLAVGIGCYGFGHGCVSPVIYSAVLRGIPARSAGAASGMLTTIQQVAQAFGVAFIGLLFATVLGRSDEPIAKSHGFAAACALSVNVVLMVTAALLSLRLPREAMR